MRGVEVAFAVGWGMFWLYWLVAALFMKRGHIQWSRELGSKAAVAVAAIVLVQLGVLTVHNVNRNVWLSGLGLAIFVMGLGFAIWARLRIGRNWGTPMTRKDHPELVTSGPYHLVRHPIYSGVVFGGIGTAIGLGWRWLIAVGLVGAYFFYSAAVEERYLSEQFPESYPLYKRSTKMLVPFIF